MLHLIHVEFNVNWMKKGNGFYLIYLLKKTRKYYRVSYQTIQTNPFPLLLFCIKTSINRPSLAHRYSI